MPIGLFIGMLAAGTFTSALGQLSAGNKAKQAAEFNAHVAEIQAQDAEDRGKQDEARFRQGVKGLIGSQRASFAGQNVDVGVGSAVDVQADTAFMGELDAQAIRANAAREAWGLRQEATSLRMGGQAAQSASRWGAASTVAGGVASYLGARYGLGRSRVG